MPKREKTLIQFTEEVTNRDKILDRFVSAKVDETEEIEQPTQASKQPGYASQAKSQPGQIQASQETARLNLSYGKKGFYQCAMALDDEILPRLTPPQQSVLRYLYRLSHGFGRTTTDHVSLRKISEKANVSLATTKVVVKFLEDHGYIKRIQDEYKFNSKDPSGKSGNRYEVLSTLAISQPGYKPARLSGGHIIDDLNLGDDENIIKGDDAEIRRWYETYTGNPWREGDATMAQEYLSTDIRLVRIGILYSLSRATSKVNSLSYCRGQIEEWKKTPLGGRAIDTRLESIEAEWKEGKLRTGMK